MTMLTLWCREEEHAEDIDGEDYIFLDFRLLKMEFEDLEENIARIEEAPQAFHVHAEMPPDFEMDASA